MSQKVHDGNKLQATRTFIVGPAYGVDHYPGSGLVLLPVEGPAVRPIHVDDIKEFNSLELREGDEVELTIRVVSRLEITRRKTDAG